MKGYSANRPVPYVRVLTGGLSAPTPHYYCCLRRPPVCRRRRLLPVDPFNRDGCLDMVNGLHLCSPFLASDHSESFTIVPHTDPFMHTFTHRRRWQPCKVTASSSGAAGVRCLGSGTPRHSAGRSRGSNWQPSGYQSTCATTCEPHACGCD